MSKTYGKSKDFNVEDLNKSFSKEPDLETMEKLKQIRDFAKENEMILGGQRLSKREYFTNEAYKSFLNFTPLTINEGEEELTEFEKQGIRKAAKAAIYATDVLIESLNQNIEQ